MKISEFKSGVRSGVSFNRPLATQIYVPQPYVSLLTETVENGDEKILFYKSDISLLFNQQRIDKLGVDGVR